MPRWRKYAAAERAYASVAISRRAAVPLPAIRRRQVSPRALGCRPVLRAGTARKRRASSATSRKSTRPQLSRITSSRSPYSVEAELVQRPAAPGPDSGSAEPDEHRPAWRVANVAHRPVAAMAPSVGQVMAAYRLGVTGQAARQFGSVAGHHATSRRANIMLRRSCQSSVRQRPNADAPHNPSAPHIRSWTNPLRGRVSALSAGYPP